MVSVGELLKRERLRKNITLKQVEKELRVREKLLQAIEENNWDLFTSKIYITGVIKNYARYLDLDVQKMLVFFRRDYEKKEEVKFKERLSARYLHPQTKRIAFVLLGFLICAFVIYFGYQLTQFLAPPPITLISPTQTHFKLVDKVRIVGKTDKDAVVTIYGERVYQNTDGVFEYDFPLKQKSNDLIIDVVGANGKKNELKRQLILD